MLLCVDIGNSSAHFGVFEGRRLIHEGHISAEDPNEAPERVSDHIIERAVIASVAPGRTPGLIEWVERATGVRPLVAGVDLAVRIKTDTRHPERVGVDRLLNGLAAFERTKTTTVVVDAGTAITVDLVDKAGTFRGGAIAPGPGPMMAAMRQGTEKLPRVSFARPECPVGRDTEEAMRSGAYWGAIGMIERLIRETKAEANGPCRVLGTGGWAPTLAPDIPDIEEVAPTLTLEGLAIAAERQR